jgi:hypothetical protein
MRTPSVQARALRVRPSASEMSYCRDDGVAPSLRASAGGRTEYVAPASKTNRTRAERRPETVASTWTCPMRPI